MAEGDDEAVTRIVEDILAYLRAHPNATDTLEGIAKWWLPALPGAAPVEQVQQALEQLIERGQVVRKALPDGAAVYSSTARDGETRSMENRR